MFVATLATLATNIGPLLVPRRGVVTTWRAWYPRGFGPSGSPRGKHKHSTLHTTFRKIQKFQPYQVHLYCQSTLSFTERTEKYKPHFVYHTTLRHFNLSPLLADSTPPNGRHPLPMGAYRSSLKIFHKKYPVRLKVTYTGWRT